MTSDARDPSPGTQAPAELGFDPDALRAKYREERERRLRPDGNDQYLEVKGGFVRFVEDPYVAPGFTRAPVDEEADVAVIGGGFGGTWYWNRYPGAMCDVESYIYLPLLEELGTVPTEKYADRTNKHDLARRTALEGHRPSAPC